jgi:hypothetical protein
LIKEKFYYDNTIKYNIELTEIDFKKIYSFKNDVYLITEIHEIMEITEQKLELI